MKEHDFLENLKLGIIYSRIESDEVNPHHILGSVEPANQRIFYHINQKKYCRHKNRDTPKCRKNDKYFYDSCFGATRRQLLLLKIAVYEEEEEEEGRVEKLAS